MIIPPTDLFRTLNSHFNCFISQRSWYHSIWYIMDPVQFGSTSRYPGKGETGGQKCHGRQWQHSIWLVIQTILLLFQKSFWRTHVLFWGPLVPLFWISGDVSSGFQSQSGFCLICRGECNVHSPRSTSGARCSNLLAAGMPKVTSPPDYGTILTVTNITAV